MKDTRTRRERETEERIEGGKVWEKVCNRQRWRGEKKDEEDR